MIHKPIQIKNLSLSFPHKTCFDNFNAQINYGNRIAIIGRNGSGKTTLLNILHGAAEPTSGIIKHSDEVVFGFVPQIIEDFDLHSGGQRLNLAITRALSLNPNVLLMDEPTNHLDQYHRKSLIRMLQSYSGTLIAVSHDTELLRSCMHTLWHIDNGQIQLFEGKYDDYIREIRSYHTSIEKDLIHLKQQKKHIHNALMKEQKRAAHSKVKGEKSIQQRKWPTVVSNAKASRSEKTSGRKKLIIDHKKQDLMNQLSNKRLPEMIVPKFSLNSEKISERAIVSISDGKIMYAGKDLLLQNINLSISSKDRAAIQGNNASGKSTLIKAILGDDSIVTSGYWHLPKRIDIGYLDQHYNTLYSTKTVLETITELVPNWSYIEARRHLNDFLFIKNEDVNNNVANLSGGEKARLSLAKIAAKTPKLLILDEITNNIDMETKEHIVQVLKAYPGAIIVISHENDFLEEIAIQDRYHIINGMLYKSFL